MTTRPAAAARGFASLARILIVGGGVVGAIYGAAYGGSALASTVPESGAGGAIYGAMFGAPAGALVGATAWCGAALTRRRGRRIRATGAVLGAAIGWGMILLPASLSTGTGPGAITLVTAAVSVIAVIGVVSAGSPPAAALAPRAAAPCR